MFVHCNLFHGSGGRFASWLALLGLVCGCSPDSNDIDPPESSPSVARSEITRGPIRVTVEVAPHPARLSDEPTLTLTLDYEQGVEVDRPLFGERHGDFLIRDLREPMRRTSGDREVLEQVYTLEPSGTGSLRIDPIPITFTDTRAPAAGHHQTLETSALTIDVQSVVTAENPSLDDLEGLAAPVSLPSSPAWLWWLGPPFVLLLVAAIGLWRLRRRSAKPVAEQVPPREQAGRELSQLWDEYNQHGDVKEFYVRLTAIVRRYIEETTGIRAPEQTTGEFLETIESGAAFGTADRRRLGNFLESADLVKFAAYRPAPADTEEAFHRARRFVGLDSAEGPA